MIAAAPRKAIGRGFSEVTRDSRFMGSASLFIVVFDELPVIRAVREIFPCSFLVRRSIFVGWQEGPHGRSDREWSKVLLSVIIGIKAPILRVDFR